MSENDNNNSNENVFFSLDESDQSENSNEIPNFLDDFDFSNDLGRCEQEYAFPKLAPSPFLKNVVRKL